MTAEAIAPGRLVGKYRVQGLLGETPWASTYAAYLPSSEASPSPREGDGEEEAGEEEEDEPAQVALKMIDAAAVAARPQLLDELRKMRERVQSVPAELVLAQIDEGEEEGLGPWSVSSLSSHPSLADLIGVCPLSADEIVGFANRLALALQAFHDRGIAHLAIKPTNVFVGPPPSHVVRLGDYGSDALCRAAGAIHPWLAPEQAQVIKGAAAGAAADAVVVGPRADVFAMGLIIFFALTGQSYWSSSSSDDVDRVLEEMRAPRVLPSLRARDVGVEIDPSIDEVLVRALATSPEDRFASVRAFADALAVGGDAIMPAVAAPVVVPTAAAVAPAAKTEVKPAPSERHLKATKKLVRFDLPKVIVSEPLPLAKRTVRIGKFDIASEEPGATSQPEPGGAGAGGGGAAALNLTARMAPASVSTGGGSPVSSRPLPQPPPQKAHARFDLPAPQAQRPPPGTIRLPGNVPVIAVVIAGFGLLVILTVVFVIVLILTSR